MALFIVLVRFLTVVCVKRLSAEDAKKTKLILIGGCRNKEDEERVQELRRQSDLLGITDNVSTCILNHHYAQLRNLTAISFALYTKGGIPAEFLL